MKFSPDIDLGRSLRQVFGNDPASSEQIEQDRRRQTRTAKAILQRFFSRRMLNRREMVILADEVGLGKTYVAIAVAVSILDAIRRGNTPSGFPTYRPLVLVLTPSNDSLFNKWKREMEAFKQNCAIPSEALDWLNLSSPVENSSKSGNVIDLTQAIRSVTLSQPTILVAKMGVFGAAIHERDMSRRRALATVFESFHVSPSDRPWWCRQVLGSGSQDFAGELLDLRRSHDLWTDAEDVSSNLAWAYEKASRDQNIQEGLGKALRSRDYEGMQDTLDDLTRLALAGNWPAIPLVIINEVHNLKNEYVQARRHLEWFLGGRVCRLLGLSATPFQLRHDELLSVLGMRSLLSLSAERAGILTEHVCQLADAMRQAREGGDEFRHRWLALRACDQNSVQDGWHAVRRASKESSAQAAQQLRPPRVANAIMAALNLVQCNRNLRKHLHPFVIRQHRQRGYREHFIGRLALLEAGAGTPHFAWAPGIEVCGNEELAHYLMMRAVSLAKDEKGLPGLGAELTGSYRHLVETAAVWRRLAHAKNPLLRTYRGLLEKMINVPDADRDHRKVQTTVRRAIEFFRRGQKSLVFCVFTKTAEAIRDQMEAAVQRFLGEARERVFGSTTAFENFRKRFFNRREPLYSLIQDQPLLGQLHAGVGIPYSLRLGEEELRKVAEIMLENGELPEEEKPDRRLLLAAAEHVAVCAWQTNSHGRRWLNQVLKHCQELEEQIAAPAWLVGRGPLTKAARVERANRDPEAAQGQDDPLAIEDVDTKSGRKLVARDSLSRVSDWVARLRKDAIGDVIAPYLKTEFLPRQAARLPLLAFHHARFLAQLGLNTRIVAGQVFRRILMADEFLLRYLADVERESTERWVEYLGDRYVKPLDGHHESLRDRVSAYLETLVQAEE